VGEVDHDRQGLGAEGEDELGLTINDRKYSELERKHMEIGKRGSALAIPIGRENPRDIRRKSVTVGQGTDPGEKKVKTQGRKASV